MVVETKNHLQKAFDGCIIPDHMLLTSVAMIKKTLTAEQH
jgi:hypothetical protein